MPENPGSPGAPSGPAIPFIPGSPGRPERPASPREHRHKYRLGPYKRKKNGHTLQSFQSRQPRQTRRTWWSTGNTGVGIPTFSFASRKTTESRITRLTLETHTTTGSRVIVARRTTGTSLTHHAISSLLSWDSRQTDFSLSARNSRQTSIARRSRGARFPREAWKTIWTWFALGARWAWNGLTRECISNFPLSARQSRGPRRTRASLNIRKFEDFLMIAEWEGMT